MGQLMSYSYSSKSDKNTVKLNGIDDTNNTLYELLEVPKDRRMRSPQVKLETAVAALNSIRLISKDEVSRVRAQRALIAIGLLIERDK